MVFEQLFKIRWLVRKEHSFFLGFAYSVVGILSAALIFPANVGLMSLAFTSVLLIPSLAFLLKLEENVEAAEKSFSPKHFFQEHKDIFKIYLFVFLGVFTAYFLASLLLPQSTVQSYFPTQLSVIGFTGSATQSAKFVQLVSNNLLVFVVCFVLSLVYGAGAILFITWNASTWGIVFGMFQRQVISAGQPLPTVVLFILPFLPHLITEGIAYISSAISGGILSKAVLREKLFSEKFYHIVYDSIIILVLGLLALVIAAFIESRFF